jgi:glycine/D-amino acid oxidase-like deaminating enzyme
MNSDVVVIGGGLVGSAIAYGLAVRGARVTVLDGDDRDFRASNANGGLIWLQAKGLGMPAYQQLSRTSVDLWPDFDAELAETAGLDVQAEHNGGLMLCVGEEQFEQRRSLLARWHNEVGCSGTEPDWEMVGRDALADLLPKVDLGPQVIGASFGHRDGQCNPLRLLAALHLGIQRRGGEVRGGATVHAIEGGGQCGFSVKFGIERASAAQVVIAAGLGARSLAAQVGLDIPIWPQRGQMLVTERLESFLPMPLHGISQTQQGTVLIGTTKEEAGFDASTTSEALAGLGARTVRLIPALRDAKLVRQWAGLRIMTPDGCPIYEESDSHPGAFVAVCHSGVTLAAAHAGLVAEAVLAGRLPAAFDVFHQRRFDVPKAA